MDQLVQHVLVTRMVSTFLNGSIPEMADSELDLTVAGTENAVLMVESEAKELSESVMLGAVMFGHAEMQVAIKAIQEFADEVGTEKWDWQAPEENTSVLELVESKAKDAITSSLLYCRQNGTPRQA